VSEFRSSRALEASALVGRQVEINSNVGSLPPQGDLKATVALPASTDRLQISVLSQTGEIVHVEEVRAQGAGDVPFSWSGINEGGEQQPAGRYQLRAIALLDGEPTEVPVKVAANVNSVSIGSDNSMTLNIDGIGKVPLDSVSRFL